MSSWKADSEYYAWIWLNPNLPSNLTVLADPAQKLCPVCQPSIGIEDAPDSQLRIGNEIRYIPANPKFPQNVTVAPAYPTAKMMSNFF